MSRSNGIGLTGAVFIVFLVLKLTGTIGWSWWWVTAPLWAPWAVGLGLSLGFAALVGLARLLLHALDTRGRRRRRAYRKSRPWR